VRELDRNTITVPSSVTKHRGFAVLGAAPELTQRTLRALPPNQRTPLGCLTFAPSSAFATAFRDLQDAIGGDKLVAFVSARPEDGATTVALGAAVSAMQQGRSVIVVDCDVRRRALSRALGGEPQQGLLEACEHPTEWRKFVEEEPETGLHFLPAARPANAWRTLMGTAGFSELLTALRQCYDLVILDCPPALSMADGAFVASQADRCIIVAGWDRTPMKEVRRTVQRVRNHAPTATSLYVNRVLPGYRFALN